jgi:hypothetical protein
MAGVVPITIFRFISREKEVLDRGGNRLSEPCQDALLDLHTVKKAATWQQNANLFMELSLLMLRKLKIYCGYYVNVYFHTVTAREFIPPFLFSKPL